MQKNCLLCDNPIVRNSPRANNKKFCTPEHRVTYMKILHPERNKIWQQNKADKANKPAANKIQCLICSKWYVQVGTHIVQRHEMTAREYREKFNLEVKRGLTSPEYRAIKAEPTLINGTINNLKKGKKFWFVKNDPRAGKYKRSPITLERLRNHAKEKLKNKNQKQ